MKFIIIFIALMAAVMPGSISNAIEMPAIFSDNMVLQQKSKVQFWGKAKPGEIVVINASWGAAAKTEANSDGLWKTKVKTTKAGGPYEVKIKIGDSTIVYKNVLLGEVWLCSGQSNMEMPLEGWPPQAVVKNSAEEIKEANYQNIRLFSVSRAVSIKPEFNCSGKWSLCDSKTAAKFSAAGYFFGRELYKNLKVPIGLISAPWGGTPIETWMSSEYLGKVDEYKPIIGKIDSVANENKKLNDWIHSHPVIYLNSKDEEHKWENLEFGDSSCAKSDFNDANWKNINLPVYWENTEAGNFDGLVWFRKKIEVPRTWIGKDLVLELGPVDAMDRSYVNGTLVGGIEKTGFWQQPRVYNIPKELVKDSVLTIAAAVIIVKALDPGGGGGIWGNYVNMNIHPMVSSENADQDSSGNYNSGSISLKGDWKYLPVAEFISDKFYVYKIEGEEFNSRPKASIDISPNTPTMLYNGMIAPLVSYGIKGTIWYQGETNVGAPYNFKSYFPLIVGAPYNYKTLFPLMIKNWRDKWGEGNFPFYFVQIAPCNYESSAKSYIIREAQFLTLSVPNTGIAVTLDIATLNNIHPPNKQDVGKRLALWALAKNYNKKIVYSGPLYKSMKIKKNKVVLEFDDAGTGLMFREIRGETNFIIAGKDKKFFKAEVNVDGKKLIVFSSVVKEPAAVRYEWNNQGQATLFNKEQLPASTFRTDKWDE
jgi:sialate O-acetylesterase